MKYSKILLLFNRISEHLSEILKKKTEQVLLTFKKKKCFLFSDLNIRTKAENYMESHNFTKNTLIRFV